MKKKNNEGFSLVELIIVIAIMAVLVIVLAPTFLKFVEKGRETTDMDNVTMAKEAVQVYVADKGLKGTDTFTVEFTATTNGKIKITAPSTVADTALAEYGIGKLSEVADLTSDAWSDKLVWTYSNYEWKSTNATTIHADYYYANGKEYTAP